MITVILLWLHGYMWNKTMKLFQNNFILHVTTALPNSQHSTALIIWIFKTFMFTVHSVLLAGNSSYVNTHGRVILTTVFFGSLQNLSAAQQITTRYPEMYFLNVYCCMESLYWR